MVRAMQESSSAACAAPVTSGADGTPAPLREVPVAAWRLPPQDAPGAATSAPQQRTVAAEVPVALVFNDISHAVMMATPQDLEAFAVGFALSEGIVVDQFARLKEHRRALAGRTGCGVCGIDSLQALDLHPETVPVPPWVAGLDVETLARAFTALGPLQVLNAQAGSLHAAGWATPDGQLTDVLEDVGRHNALDKLLGRLALAGRLGEPGFVVMTSRTSYELVRKCARLGVPALATISAPTGLALQLAREAGMQLWGMCRPPAAVRYV